MKKREFEEFLYEICADCDCHGREPYCTLVEFIVSAHQSPRMIMQMKCVEKFKYEKHTDLNWSDAFQLWVDEGYAKTFGDLYSEELRFRSLYKNVIEKTKNRN